MQVIPVVAVIGAKDLVLIATPSAEKAHIWRENVLGR